jgi:CRISPR/Cas system-associated protein Csm6
MTIRPVSSVKRRFATEGAVLAALALLSGCGGSSSSDQTAKFKTDFGSVVNHLRDTSRSIGTAIQQASSQTDAQIGTTFQGLASQWHSHLSGLATLKPPSNVSTEFNTLTGAAGRAETDLTAIAAAAGSHSNTAATKATTSLITDIMSAKSASTTITQRLGIK